MTRLWIRLGCEWEGMPDDWSARVIFLSLIITVLCTLTLKEIIKYYNQNGSFVYCCSLDMSKAFDMVRHDDLLYLLKNRGIPALDLQVVKDAYPHQRV